MYLHVTMVIIGSIKKQYLCMSSGPNSPSVLYRGLLRRLARKGLTRDPYQNLQAVCNTLPGGAETLRKWDESWAWFCGALQGPHRAVMCLHPFADLSARILLKFTQAKWQRRCITAHHTSDWTTTPSRSLWPPSATALSTISHWFGDKNPCRAISHGKPH